MYLIKAEKVLDKNNNVWIKATFNKNKYITDNILKIRGVLYDPKRNVWAIPYDKRAEFETKLNDFIIDWVDEPTPFNGGIDENLYSKYPNVPGYSVTYRGDEIVACTGFKEKPWAEYQVRGFNAIVDRDFLILGDDMGLGKTFQVITAIEAKRKLGMLKRALILAKATLLYNWRDEIEKFTNCKSVVFAGTPKQRYSLVNYLCDSDDWTFLIMSFEMYRISIGTVTMIDNYNPINCLIVDEAQKIKNPISKIGQRVHYIPFKYKYVLTATPLPNTPLEAFNYLKLGNTLPINDSNIVREWWRFKNRYAILGGFNNREIIGYKNINELRSIIQENMLRRTKQEKLKDLPEVTFKTINLEMTPSQKKIYEAIRKEIMEELKETDIHRVPSMLAKITRLQQVTGSPQLIGAPTKKGDSIKFEALDDLIEEIVEGAKEKVIIFTKFKELLHILADRYSKFNCAIIHGDVPTSALPEKEALERCKKKYGTRWNTMSESEKSSILKELTTSARQQQVYKFQEDPTCKLFIGTTEACKEGLTLTAASNVIFVDYPWNWASYSQAFSRAHRIGQKNAVTVYNLICKGSVDEKIFKVIMDKKSLSEFIIDTKVNMDEVSTRRAFQFIKDVI